MTDDIKDREAPRAYTEEEMRKQFLAHLRGMVDYWSKVELHDPEYVATRGGGDLHWRLDGLAFSILVTLDGGSGGLPAYDLIPSPHPSDKEFHQEQGENWFPEDTVINDTQLHESWHHDVPSLPLDDDAVAARICAELCSWGREANVHTIALVRLVRYLTRISNLVANLPPEMRRLLAIAGDKLSQS